MARSHVRLHFGMWRKEGHEKTSKDARWLYVTILSDETLNQAGVVRVSMDVWADDAGMTTAEAEAALLELALRRFVVVDRHELLVRTFIRNDGVAEQPNVLRNALAVATQVRSPILRRALAAELRRLPAPLPPRETPGGRKFIYPDPHATAAEIDPGPPGPEDDDYLEPFPEPFPEAPQNTPGTLPEGTLPGTLQGTPRGRGRGRGSSSPPVIDNSTLGKTHSRASRAATDTTPDGFDDFWSAYPIKVGKQAAINAYRRALKRGAEPAYMLTAARRYAAVTRASERRFIAHPTTWLNQGRYDDEHPDTAVAIGQHPPTTPQGTSSQRANAILALRRGDPR